MRKAQPSACGPSTRYRKTGTSSTRNSDSRFGSVSRRSVGGTGLSWSTCGEGDPADDPTGDSAGDSRADPADRSAAVPCGVPGDSPMRASCRAGPCPSAAGHGQGRGPARAGASAQGVMTSSVRKRSASSRSPSMPPPARASATPSRPPARRVNSRKPRRTWVAPVSIPGTTLARPEGVSAAYDGDRDRCRAEGGRAGNGCACGRRCDRLGGRLGEGRSGGRGGRCARLGSGHSWSGHVDRDALPRRQAGLPGHVRQGFDDQVARNSRCRGGHPARNPEGRTEILFVRPAVENANSQHPGQWRRCAQGTSDFSRRVEFAGAQCFQSLLRHLAEFGQHAIGWPRPPDVDGDLHEAPDIIAKPRIVG